MTPHVASRPRLVSRRSFLGALPAAVGLIAAGGPRGASGRGEPTRSPGDDPDALALTLPVFTSNGAKVPVTVEMSHPMEPGHYVSSVSVMNERDRWHRTRSITIPEGGGGCAGTAPPPGRTGPDEIGPPTIRIPQLIAEGSIGPHQTIDIQIKTKHPSRTGLAVREGKFVQAGDPLYLSQMDVFYGDQPISRFTLTSALSDNPWIAFRLRAPGEDLLRVVLANNRGQRFEAVHPIRFS